MCVDFFALAPINDFDMWRNRNISYSPYMTSFFIFSFKIREKTRKIRKEEIPSIDRFSLSYTRIHLIQSTLQIMINTWFICSASLESLKKMQQ